MDEFLQPGGQVPGFPGPFPTDVAPAAVGTVVLSEIAQQISGPAFFLLGDEGEHRLDPLVEGASEQVVPLGRKLDVSGTEPVVEEIDDVGPVGRDVLDDVVHGEPVQELPEFRDRDAAFPGDEAFVDGNGIGEKRGVGAHQGLQERNHPGIGQFHAVEFGPVDGDLHPGLDLEILAESPVPFPFDVFDGVEHGGLLEPVSPAEGREVELQLPAHPGVVGDFVEDVDLVVDVLDVFQGREGGVFDLGEPFPVSVVPEQDGIGG